MKIENSDWKLFKEKLPVWQNRYMEKLCGEYREILSAECEPAEKFWQLEERIRKDKHHPGVMLEMRRDNVLMAVVNLVNDKVIDVDEISGFSIQFKEAVAFLLGI